MSPSRPRSTARPGSPLLAVAYLRLSPRNSTPDDARLGLTAQRAAIEAFALQSQPPITITSWHIDQDVSGATTIDERPAFLAALSAVRASRSGLLIVAKRDRLARDVVVAAMAERATEAFGARLVSADGTGNGSGPADAFMRTVIDGAAAYERALIRARTKAVLAAKRARGERTGSVPYGSSLSPDGVHLVPEPAEQATIATVKALRAQGLSLRAVTEELESLDLFSRNGKPFALAQVVRIIARDAA